MALYQKLVKLAQERPEFRADLMPVIRSASKDTYYDTNRKPLSKTDIAWIKKCAQFMKLGWESIASRPQKSKILLDAKAKGDSVPEACEAYRKG